MKLLKLKLTHFRNYVDEDLHFKAKINVLVGENGSGKTNLLDTIYYLALTKSSLLFSDSANIKHGESFFRIVAEIAVSGATHEISAGFQVGSKKSFCWEGREYQKLSDHLGKFPLVLVSPDDTDLVKGSSEGRRRFFDSMISQMDSDYLKNLIQYNQNLRQRNSLLKMFQETGKPDLMALDVYDDNLVRYGMPLYEKRLHFMASFNKAFQRYFSFLVSEKDKVSLSYKSEVTSLGFENGLKASRNRDLFMQRTHFGIHKDDYEFLLDGFEMKRFGSQGQQKSLVIALKLAQWHITWEEKGFKPLLLLDDIFDKLDDHRIAKLLVLVKDEFGQIFITDARPDRTSRLLKGVGDVCIYEVVNGKISKK